MKAIQPAVSSNRQFEGYKASKPIAARNKDKRSKPLAAAHTERRRLHQYLQETKTSLIPGGLYTGMIDLEGVYRVLPCLVCSITVRLSVCLFQACRLLREVLYVSVAWPVCVVASNLKTEFPGLTSCSWLCSSVNMIEIAI